MERETLLQAEIIMQRCERLAACSEEPDRLTRRYGTPALREARDLVTGWMGEAGLAVRRDAVGNVIGRRRAAVPGAKTLLIGSHLDSVRDAGKYDGPLGVLTAIAAVQSLGDAPLPFAVEIYAFAEEEGLRFHTSYLGSRALTGTLDAATLAATDADGISVAEAMAAFGGDPATLDGARRDPADLLGYLEVHIEQGPVLEQRGLPVGVVTDIIGSSKSTIAFHGTAGHAGTVPMALRHDALSAAAEFVLVVEEAGRTTEGLVATVGRLNVEPGATNVIPGLVSMSLDLRHANDATWLSATDHLHRRAWEIAAKRGVEVETRMVMETPAVACDPALIEIVEHAIQDCGVQPLRMVSGAGHDAVPLSRITPVAMVFVRCKGGISHNPAESVDVEDTETALAVLTRLLLSIPSESS